MINAFFEGPDTVGKSSLARAFVRQAYHLAVGFDRSVISNYVYDIKFNRHIKIDIYRYMDALAKTGELDLINVFFLVEVTDADLRKFYEARSKTEDLGTFEHYCQETHRDAVYFKSVFTALEDYCHHKKYGNILFIKIKNEFGDVNNTAKIAFTHYETRMFSNIDQALNNEF